MAGHGPAPKPVEQRRDRHQKARGEWVDLPPSRTGPVPKLPAGDWSERTLASWKAWWRDPAATQWTAADVDNVLALAFLAEKSLFSHAAEIRLRMDGLGLTQKGKRDMRWRVSEPESAVEPEKPKASAVRRSRLKVV